MQCGWSRMNGEEGSKRLGQRSNEDGKVWLMLGQIAPLGTPLEPGVNHRNMEKTLDSGYVFKAELTFSGGLELGCEREKC